MTMRLSSRLWRLDSVMALLAAGIGLEAFTLAVFFFEGRNRFPASPAALPCSSFF